MAEQTFYDSNIPNGAALDAAYAKVALIEDEAQVNPTAAEIKTAYEGNADTNAFTDDEKTKLTNIEENATADMSAGEIKTAYESNADTNAYVDTEKALVSGYMATPGVLAPTGDTQEINFSTVANVRLDLGAAVSTGSITAIADAGGGDITLTSDAHGRSNGDYVAITDTNDNDGIFEISNVTTDTFDVTSDFVATDTGTWEELNTDDLALTFVLDANQTKVLVIDNNRPGREVTFPAEVLEPEDIMVPGGPLGRGIYTVFKDYAGKIWIDGRAADVS